MEQGKILKAEKAAIKAEAEALRKIAAEQSEALARQKATSYIKARLKAKQEEERPEGEEEEISRAFNLDVEQNVSL